VLGAGVDPKVELPNDVEPWPNDDPAVVAPKPVLLVAPNGAAGVDDAAPEPKVELPKGVAACGVDDEVAAPKGDVDELLPPKGVAVCAPNNDEKGWGFSASVLPPNGEA
jgi:hypothetical protein